MALITKEISPWAFSYGGFECESCWKVLWVPGKSGYDEDLYKILGQTICYSCIVTQLESTIGPEGKWRQRKVQLMWLTNRP